MYAMQQTEKNYGSLKLFGNCSHDGPTGSTMLYHVLMRPLVASASSIASVFIIDVCDAGAATQSFMFLVHIIDGDWEDNMKLLPQL